MSAGPCHHHCPTAIVHFSPPFLLTKTSFGSNLLVQYFFFFFLQNHQVFSCDVWIAVREDSVQSDSRASTIRFYVQNVVVEIELTVWSNCMVYGTYDFYLIFLVIWVSCIGWNKGVVTNFGGLYFPTVLNIGLVLSVDVVDTNVGPY